MQNGRALTIDGFISPARRLHVPQRPVPTAGTGNRPASQPLSSPPTITYTPSAHITTPSTLTTTPDPTTSPPNRKVLMFESKPQKAEKKSYIANALETTRLFVIVTTAIALAFFSNFLYVGQLFIGVYAILALTLGIKSQTTFKLALASLACIVLITLIKPGTALAENFAVFAFLFLVIGTISMAIEVRREGNFSDITKQKFRINP